VLERRALENYLSDGAVKEVFGPAARGLDPYETLKDLHPPHGWAKGDNWRVARAMRRADLAGTDLGMFLESL
jgi:hypothetical protein